MRKLMLKDILAHPLTKNLEPDDPQTTVLRRRIILEKTFLKKLYTEWYIRLIEQIPSQEEVSGKVVELGSGGGFFKKIFPESITSEVFHCQHVDAIFDGQRMPFADKTLRALVLVDVLHHIPSVSDFFYEAERTLSPGGTIVMLEPWNTSFSRFIYQHLHSEPFFPQQGIQEKAVKRWNFTYTGPLSGANVALPWIVFERDIEFFINAFPRLRLEHLSMDYPFSYLASGGVSMRSLVPGWSFSLFRAIERSIPQRFMRSVAMFAQITVRRK